MRITTRTIYGAAIQTDLYLGRAHQPVPNSTLNEKLQIQAGATIAAADRHASNILTIGNGAHRPVPTAVGVPIMDLMDHNIDDAACFNHVPFVLREMNNDLSTEQRRQYALRRIENKDGTNYVAYYGKRINTDQSPTNMQRITVANGKIQSTVPFIPTSSNLNPTPLVEGAPSGTNVIQSSGEFLRASAVITISFNENDADEFRNVARILYGDERYAIISEFGIVSGVNRVVSGQGQGASTINYDEVVGACVANFSSVSYDLYSQNTGFTFTTDVGVSEPMLELRAPD